VQLLGVSSVEAVVARAQAEQLTGRVAVVLDAQRGEFYLATYDLSAAGWTAVEPLHIAALADVQSRLADHQIIGPEVLRWFPAGRVVLPTAATLTQLARKRADFVPGEQLEPIYLRATTFVKAPPSRIVEPGASRITPA
jgi:tRNA A37 threonylcarbamoyladenosine modification protein TsaB